MIQKSRWTQHVQIQVMILYRFDLRSQAVIHNCLDDNPHRRLFCLLYLQHPAMKYFDFDRKVDSFVVVAAVRGSISCCHSFHLKLSMIIVVAVPRLNCSTFAGAPNMQQEMFVQTAPCIKHKQKTIIWILLDVLLDLEKHVNFQGYAGLLTFLVLNQVTMHACMKDNT